MRRALGSILLLTASLAVAAGLVEVTVRSLSLFAAPRAELQGDLSARAEAQPPETQNLLHTQIHPYLGWTVRPGRRNRFRSSPIPVFPDGQLSAWTQTQRQSNLFGYWSHIEDYRQVAPEDFVVGVFGGSVASNISTIGGASLRSALAKRLGREPETVQILNFGSGGFKQPQQLIALMQAVLLEVPFDLVINLDGYNEVVLGAQDGARSRHPLFPSYRHWGSALALMASDPSEEHVALTWKIIDAHRRVETSVDWLAAGSLLTHSMTARSAVSLIAQRSRAAAIAAEQLLHELTATQPVNAAVASLPDPCFETNSECRSIIRDIWEQSSRMMATIAAESGAGYVHMLQPNQYLANSKPLSEEERTHAVLLRGGRLERVRAGYPLLLASADALRASGVVFVDLTSVFEDHPETLYRDECCHLNLRGNELLAAAIAEAVPQDLLDRAGGP